MTDPQEIRDNIKKKFATYYQMALEMREIEADLAELEEIKAAVRAQVITGMPRGSTVGDPTGTLAVKSASLEAYYRKLEAQELDRRLEIERMIANLEPLERRVIRLRYIEGKSWREVGRQLMYSEAQVRRFLDSALDKLVAEEMKKEAPYAVT